MNHRVRDLGILALVWLGVTVPFLDKAYHIDDTVHVLQAEHIAAHPTRPLEMEIFWFQWPEWLANSNPITPPTWPYELAAATALYGSGEVVLVMGIPGAGKSRVAQEYAARGYLQLNRDERGGTLRDTATALDAALAAGTQGVVLDNTYATRASRSHVLEAAARHGARVRCVWLDTPLAQAQVNLVTRLLDRLGSLPTPAELKAIADRGGVADRVRFLGQRSDVPRLMAAADVFCQPNAGPEPFGVVFVEALYAGLPVVTSAFGGAVEVVERPCEFVRHRKPPHVTPRRISYPPPAASFAAFGLHGRLGREAAG